MEKKIDKIVELIGLHDTDIRNNKDFDLIKLAAEIDALYSDPPKPDTNKLENQRYWDGVYDALHGVVKYNLEHPKFNPPSPEPPEKVRDGIAELEKAIQELLGIVNESEGIIGWHLNGDVLKWEQCESIQVISEKLPIILKLQQVGWGNTTALQARIKELEGLIPTCGNCISPEQLAEARQHALKEALESVKSLKTHAAFGCLAEGYPIGIDNAIKAIEKLQGELPKE